MREVYQVKVLSYIREGVGFIDEGWGDTTMYFKNPPTREDIVSWLRNTEVVKAKAPRIKKVEIKSEFIYVEEN